MSSHTHKRVQAFIWPSLLSINQVLLFTICVHLRLSCGLSRFCSFLFCFVFSWFLDHSFACVLCFSYTFHDWIEVLNVDMSRFD